MKWIPYGPHAWLLQFADIIGDEAFFRGRLVVAELERHPPAGLLEFVPGFTTVLLEFDPRQTQVETEILPELVKRFHFGALAKLSSAPVKEILVAYDGPDLRRVAEWNDLSPAEVVQIHSAQVYRVYLIGFAPGFPYLGDLDPSLHTPRLDCPRPRVPAGSVAIGGQHTGIYAIDSPGGWNIIGHTSFKVFDPLHLEPGASDESMFRLRAGDRVRFIPHAA
jgi:KipI family sensor histidine kinase inhibitor